MRDTLSKLLSSLAIINYCLAKPNFLLIIVDDLRPTLGCYSDGRSFTRNIDKLSKNGIVFNKTYAQLSLCAPSRNSLLTSRRPDTLKLYDFYNYWRETVGNFTTLPQYLKGLGYTTISIGKIFHPGISSNNSDDSPYSWSHEAFHPYTNRYKDTPLCNSDDDYDESFSKNLVCPVNISSMPLKTLPDIENFNAAKQFLNNYKNERHEKPFFLAVGFQKPHIPLKYPKEYLKYHQLDKFELINYNWPDNISSVAYNPWTDLRERDDVKKLNLSFPWEKIPIKFGKRILQSYYSAVSYIDELVGGVVKELNTLTLNNNTIIILTSDHGWSLGEHGQWAKYSNFEVAVRVPLIISLPKLNNNNNNNNNNNKKLRGNEKALITNSIVELVDLFPTIAELSGNPINTCKQNQTENLCTEGTSFVPLINAILSNQKIKWKRAALSQYPRPGISPTWLPNSDKPRLHQIKIMGYSLRTKYYRYTAWIEFDNIEIKSNWNSLIADELYDYKIDSHEIINQVNNTDYLIIKMRLRKQLKNGWRHNVPPCNFSLFNH